MSMTWCTFSISHNKLHIQLRYPGIHLTIGTHYNRWVGWSRCICQHLIHHPSALLWNMQSNKICSSCRFMSKHTIFMSWPRTWSIHEYSDMHVVLAMLNVVGTLVGWFTQKTCYPWTFCRFLFNDLEIMIKHCCWHFCGWQSFATAPWDWHNV